MDAPAPAATDEQKTLAAWLEILRDERQSTALRDEAVKRLAMAIISKDTEIAAIAKDFEALRIQLAEIRAEVVRLLTYQRRVIDAATPVGYAIVDERVLPLEQRKPTPPAPSALRLVKGPEVDHGRG